MPPKKKNTSKKSDDKKADGPAPPNIFLYVQLAGIGKLPSTVYPLEIHINQADSIMVKCVENYDTDGVIYQEEFSYKPTYTLIFQQDNLDRINHAADNPLLIELYMRKTVLPSINEEEFNTEGTDVENFLEQLLDFVDLDSDSDNLNFKEPLEELILLCVGYLDLIKVFGHRRAMISEEIVLYPPPNIPNHLRKSVTTEWHLYTLVPIAKELTFTNMAFVMFESIYNLKEEYILDPPTMSVQLSFRSVQPVARNEYHVIPLCTYQNFTENAIANQNVHFYFEFFRNAFDGESCMGLRSNMEVQLHRLFYDLMRSENMEIDFEQIDLNDVALICNCFHRYILTNNMSETLFSSFAMKRYVMLVEVFQEQPKEEKQVKKGSPRDTRQKIFEGILDPAILLFPGVQNIRFAVELKYLGPKKKIVKPKKPKEGQEIDQGTEHRNTLSNSQPTFAIIKICMLAPLGDIYKELKVFRESFIAQNRLLHCNLLPVETTLDIAHLQREAYSRFDELIRNIVLYIVDKNVFSVHEKRGNFCCALQNLTNILMKVMGCDFNQRVMTNTNVEFTNLCATAFNELELRTHNTIEKMENEGWDLLLLDRTEKFENLIDSMNTVKLMYAVGDTRMGNYVYERLKLSSDLLSPFSYHDLIYKMETGRYKEAKEFYSIRQVLSPAQTYAVDWIHLYLNYVDTRDDPDPAVSDNATECLLKSITQYALRHSHQSDGWLLLYCYYKSFDYAPGYSYARWKMENLISHPRTNKTTAPYSLWGIMLNLNPTFNSQQGYKFFQCFKTFTRLGLYEFAQVIFQSIQHMCDELESYLINTQLKVMLNQIDEDYQLLDDPFTKPEHKEDGAEEADEEEAPRVHFTAQINGNVEYQRGNFEKATEYYRKLDDIPAISRDFIVGKLRLAYLSYDMEDYHQTISALRIPEIGKLMPLTYKYLKGKAYYKLGELHNALNSFIACTAYGIHMPDIWGFLALINLQMGKNLHAIICWKYARIDPTKRIMDDVIYTELDLIDEDSVDLYLDTMSVWTEDDHITQGSSTENDD